MNQDGKHWLGLISLWALVAAVAWNAYEISKHPALQPSPALLQKPQIAAAKPEIEQIVHQYLLAHPQIIVELQNRVLAEEQAKEAAEDERTRSAALKHFQTLVNAPGEMLGKTGALQQDYALWYFTQPKCPSCHKTNRMIWDFVQAHPQLEFRVFYWPFFGGETVKMAKMLMSVHHYCGSVPAQNFYKALLEGDNILSVKELEKLLSKALPKISLDGLAQDSERPEVVKALKNNFLLAKKLELTGTPTIILTDKNGQVAEVISGFNEQLTKDLATKLAQLQNAIAVGQPNAQKMDNAVEHDGVASNMANNAAPKADDATNVMPMPKVNSVSEQQLIAPLPPEPQPPVAATQINS